MMPGQDCWLVIDQGGHGTRALVFNTRGSILDTAYFPLTTHHPHSGWFEQDSAELLSSLHHVLQQLQASLPNKKLRITAAALVTQRSSLVACHRDSLRAITPVISWQDTRHHHWLQTRINSGELDITALKHQTGLRLNAHYGASKMRWLLDHDTAVQTAARDNNLVFLPLAAYVTGLLTHNPAAVVDACSASRTFLVELKQQDWSPSLLELFSLDRRYLPHIVPSRYAYGTITLGDQCIPLQVVGGDQSFLPFAYGETSRTHSLFINAGTGAFVQTSLSPDDTPSAQLCSLAAMDAHETLTVAEGTVNACTSALDWLWQQHPPALDHRQLEAALHHIVSPPVFYHRITALGSPYWLAAGESTFSETADTEAKAVAVVESIVFLLAINIDLLQQAKSGLREICISGGLAHSDGFCQKLANCAQMPVVRHRDMEASARGAAFYLADIRHYHPPQAAAVFTPIREVGLLARYQHFYEWLRSQWLQTLG